MVGLTKNVLRTKRDYHTFMFSAISFLDFGKRNMNIFCAFFPWPLSEVSGGGGNNRARKKSRGGSRRARGGAPSSFFDQTEARRAEKNFLGQPTPPPPPPSISRSGSGTGGPFLEIKVPVTFRARNQIFKSKYKE